MSKSYPELKELIYEQTIVGNPTTKKNSSKIVRLHGHYAIIPSKLYREYENECLKQIKRPELPFNEPLEIKCLFFRDTKRKVDLTNLLEAIDDILVKAGVIEDDNCKVLISHDGSRVFLGCKEPRTEIYIYRGEQ